MKRICLDATIAKIMKFKYVVEEIIPVEKWGVLIDQIKRIHDKPPVIMIDYLRKLRTENSTSDERLRVDDILSNLTGLAKKHNIPVLAISELARDSYKSGQRLSMASFKESGTIEYEASWLGILAAVEEINGEYKLKNNWERIIEQDGNIDLIVFKAKRGTGATGKIPLKVDKNKMTVSDRMDENRFDAVSNIKKVSKYE
jgi:replicative DNA helicase